MIAFLGWGSLIWNPDSLAPHITHWRSDGPLMSVEFCRTSQDGRLTLVEVDCVPPVPVLWTTSLLADSAAAAEALRRRERCGLVDINVAFRGEAGTNPEIEAWMCRTGIDSVVWTGLPAKFDGRVGHAPSQVQALQYLRGLPAEAAYRAEEYVRRAPAQIRTPFRTAFELALGWHPVVERQ